MYDYFVHWSSVVVRVMRRGSTPGGQMVALLVSSCTCSTTVSPGVRGKMYQGRCIRSIPIASPIIYQKIDHQQ